jgi:hypothetical protein
MIEPHRRRRRILCVRPRVHASRPVYFQELKYEWIKALGLHAEVRVEEKDFDLREVFETFAPDLIIFESLDYHYVEPPKIEHPLVYPEIPRALLLTTDPHDPSRPILYDKVVSYGISVAFQKSGLCHSQFMPELVHLESFSIPSMIDATVFKDYGLEKTIPVSIFSAHLMPGFYPWRTQVTEELPRTLPTLLYPHPGYVRGPQAPFALRGEAYARLINQSFFSISDTTRHDYVVRKHLEIPAAGAVLVAPPSAALAEYGFEDMRNCILGSGAELARKIDAVSRRPDLYASIKSAGHDLVHTRYTHEAWVHIVEWLECRMQLRPGQRVIQNGIHGAFSVAPEAAAGPSLARGARDNQMTAVLKAARTAILAGQRLDAAEHELAQASGWTDHIAEPFFLLGIIRLLKGRPAEGALYIARRPTNLGHDDPALSHFDPVEVAWILLAAVILGQEDLFQAMRAQAALTSHLSLRRIDWLLSGSAADPFGMDPALHERTDDDILSIHWLGQESFESWCDLVSRVAAANNRPDLLPTALRTVADPVAILTI